MWYLLLFLSKQRKCFVRTDGLRRIINNKCVEQYICFLLGNGNRCHIYVNNKNVLYISVKFYWVFVFNTHGAKVLQIKLLEVAHYFIFYLKMVRDMKFVKQTKKIHRILKFYLVFLSLRNTYKCKSFGEKTFRRCAL